MLGLDWTELALIAVVAVVIIGPKDLPEAVRGIAKGIQKLRRMAGEFQGHVDEVVREAKLEDVRSQINEIRSFDFRSVVEKEIDKDGSIRSTFRDDPIGNPLKDAFDGKPAEGGAVVTPPPAGATRRHPRRRRPPPSSHPGRCRRCPPRACRRPRRPPPLPSCRPRLRPPRRQRRCRPRPPRRRRPARPPPSDARRTPCRVIRTTRSTTSRCR
jgi:sec-independent protein translocase protein TatB